MSALKTIFKDFENKYFIGCSVYSGDKLEFTYKNSFNNWSHSVALKVINGQIYFQTYRINVHEDLKPYKFTDYAHNQIGCRIPITERDLIHKVLTKYDNFKRNF